MSNETLMISGAATWILGKLFAKPLEEISEMLAGPIRNWRKRNVGVVLEQAADYAKARGIEVRSLSPKVLILTLEGASLEEEPSLQKLWARLLVNAGTVEVPLGIASIAVELLQNLSTQDAKVLDAIFLGTFSSYKRAQVSEKEDIALGRAVVRKAVYDPHSTLSRAELLESTELPERDFEVCFDNISRFNVIEAPPQKNWDGIGLPSDQYRFTRLGWKIITLIRDVGDLAEPLSGREHGSGA